MASNGGQDGHPFIATSLRREEGGPWRRGVEEEGAAAASAGPLVPAPLPQPPPLTSGGEGVTREKERGRESSRCGKREPPIVEKPR